MIDLAKLFDPRIGTAAMALCPNAPCRIGFHAVSHSNSELAGALIPTMPIFM